MLDIYTSLFSGKHEEIKLKNFRTKALGLTLLLASTQASAIPLTLDGGWQSFGFGGTGSSWYSTFEFTISDAAVLSVTDAFLAGDIFEVFADSVSLGLTSFTSDTTSQIGSDYDSAFASASWSSGSWDLAAGSYVISGVVTASPHGSGGAALRLDTAEVPVPAPLALMGLGLAALGFSQRKKLS
ncbi:MAG: PEP-CTERM sorting domain-containing protein [Sedimenticola sp.]